MAFVVTLSCLLWLVGAQQAGHNKPEVHPPMAFTTCTVANGCTSVASAVTMDAQWRWTHDARKNQYGNCIQGNAWDKTIVTDGKTAAANCAIEGMDAKAYESTYGVSTIPGGVRLKFVNGQSIGSRLYMMEDDRTYKMFKLLNREFTFDVDVSTLECGLNGAVYFVEMEANGGMGTGNNSAGAKFGTGYCDAQCPHDLKFIAGEGNTRDWHMTKTGPIGHYGSCCSEMDIWEANSAAAAYTAHPCETMGPRRCEGDGTPNVCGDTPPDCDCCGEHDLAANCPCCGRYAGVCDKDGCDYNSYRLGAKSFIGKGAEFTVDTSKPVTVVTQFLTSDGTDTGDLSEIRRLYVQDGKVIKNSEATNIGVAGSSITDSLCAAQKKAFDNRDDFSKKGGLSAMGKALGRGMVLVLSLWDDALTKMNWLDSATPMKGQTLSTPGVVRGPCSTDAGDPNTLRTQHPDAYVTYSNIMVGEIGSTYGPAAQKAKAAAAAIQAQPAMPAVAMPGQAAPVPVAQGPVGPVALPPAVPAGIAPIAGMPAAAPVPPATGLTTAGTAVGGTLVSTSGMAGGSQVASALAAPTAAGAQCCFSAKDASNKCGSCWPRSATNTGWCGTSAANCAGCGGAWCPSGVNFAAAFEEHSQVLLREAGAASLPSAVSAVAGSAVFLFFAGLAAAWLRATPRRSEAEAGRLLGMEGQVQPLDGAA